MTLTRAELLRGLLVFLLLVTSVSATDTDDHKYLVVYSTLVPWDICEGGTCLAVYCDGPCMKPEEHNAWFGSIKEALLWVNSPPGSFYTFGGLLNPSRKPPEQHQREIVGIYRVEAVPIKQVKVGTQKREVTKTVEEKVDKLEWQVKP